MKRNSILFLTIIALAFLGTAGAQVDVAPGVARVSLMHGDVSAQRGDTGDWAAAALNQPVVTGDSISTGDRSRAEIQLDRADILRLGNNSQVKLATLTRTQLQVQVGQGLVYYSVYKDSEAQIEIDTPNVSIRPTSRDGVYRIQVDGGDTQVVVRKGAADISTPQGSQRLEKGQAALVRGTADEAEYKLISAPSKDGWDSWNSERDSTIRNAQSWRHTNDNYVGSEDLDAYGNWVNVPDYGYVWQPTVAVDWAPYRVGRWVYEPYWGWTWASYEPWGWAPYHYGRWMFWNSSWVWWPGPVTPFYQPIWAPAYVSFFGFGGGWGVGFGFGGGWGFGGFGWLPIGPCDRFYPWYGRYGNHFNMVNITNINNFNGGHFGGFAPLHGGNRFSNLQLASTDPHVRGGMSMLRHNEFGTRAAAQAVNAETFRNGHMMTGNLPLVPERNNLSVSGRPASAATTAGNLHNQRFFTNHQPAATQSFERQTAQLQQAIRSNPQMGGSHAGAAQAGNAQRGYGSAGASGSSVAGQPAMRTTQSGETRGAASNNGAQAASSGGWQHFGNGQMSRNQPPNNPAQSGNPNRSYAAEPAQSTVRGGSAGQGQASAGDRYGWHKFSGAAGQQNDVRGSAPRGAAGNSGAQTSAPVNAGPGHTQAQPDRSAGWQRFTPQNQPSGSSRSYAGTTTEAAPRYTPNEGRASGYGSAGGSRAQSYRQAEPSYRPPLNLRQPIVTPRGGYSSGGSRGGYSGGGSRGSSGGGSRGGYSGGGGSHGGSSGGGSHSGGRSR